MILLALGLTPKAAPAPYQGEADQQEVMGAAPRCPRSVRLRHRHGPVSTVPFNFLGAVENMGRDWVIDKIAIDVTYDRPQKGEEADQADGAGATEGPGICTADSSPRNRPTRRPPS